MMAIDGYLDDRAPRLVRNHGNCNYPKEAISLIKWMLSMLTNQLLSGMIIQVMAIDG